MKKFVVVIPCRLKSKRFPKKLLQKINGKEIFVHTYNQCLKSTKARNIFIVTDSKKIKFICDKNNIQCVLSSKKNKTGTDRIYEFSKKIKSQVYINVQGDEPIINPSNIKKIINYSLKNPREIINGYSNLDKKEAKNPGIPKLIFDRFKYLIYMSRHPIPYNHIKKNNINYYKQVCVYSFPRKTLSVYKNKKTYNEEIEDIEILRLLENGYKVKMIKLTDDSFSIDYPRDIIKLKKKLNLFKYTT